MGHLATLARSVSTHDPRTPLISNRDGQVVHDGRDVLRRIVGQIASPVRWDLCMETMTDLGVTGVLEMPPAGTLTGIAKRALQGRRDVRAQDPRPARRRPRVLRQARRGVGDRHHARPGGWSSPRSRAPSTAPSRPPTPTSSSPAP